MNYEPLVSIIIPVYNGSNFLSDAIESALNQTYKNIEIIVVNDGSNDGGRTEAIALSYGNLIRYYSKENGGVSSALNYAAKKMKGEWLSWLSHDDMYKPQKIEKQVLFLNQLLAEYSLEDVIDICVYSSLERVDSNGEFLSKKNIQIPPKMSAIDALIYNIKTYTIGGCTVLMSKKLFNKMEGFDETVRTVSDADLWFRMMLSNHVFYHLDEVLVKSRQHKQQVGNRSKALFKREHAVLMEKITKRLIETGLSKKQKYALAEGLIQNGFVSPAESVFRELKKSGENDLFLNFKIKIVAAFKWKLYFLVRSVYRLLTLK